MFFPLFQRSADDPEEPFPSADDDTAPFDETMEGVDDTPLDMSDSVEESSSNMTLCSGPSEVSKELSVSPEGIVEDLPLDALSAQNILQQTQQLELATLANSYPCTMCSLVFPTEARLRTHAVSHSTEAYHRCPLCTLKYKRASDLNRHMKRKHNIRLREYYTSEQSEPLNLCVKKAAPSIMVAPVMASGDQPLDLSVKAPAKALPARPNFGADGEGLRCNHCAYIAKWPSDLQRHMLVHSMEKRFRCTMCQRRYKYKFDLNMHLRKMHKVSAGRTRVPGSDPIVPASSITTSDTQESEYSTEEQAVPEALNYHLDPTHSNSPVMSYSPSEESLTVDEPQSPSLSIVEQQGKYVASIKPLKAAAAEKLAKSPRQLQLSPAGKFRCEFCPYLGACRSEVDRHMRLHTGEKPYSCVFCSYKSHWKGDMKRHIQKHHPTELENENDIEEIMLKTHQPGRAFDHIRTPLDPNKHVVTSLKLTPSPEASNPLPSNLMMGSDGEVTPVVIDKDSFPSENMCPLCQFVCDPAQLRTHMESHGCLKRFQCAHCGKRSDWPWELHQHSTDEHTNQPITIVLLSEEMASNTLQEYRAKFMARKALEFKENEEEQGQKEQGLSALEEMNAALESTLAEQRSEQDAGLPREGRFRPFMCSECGRRSNWKWDLRKHLSNVHPNATMVTLSEEEAQRQWPPARSGKEDAMSDISETSAHSGSSSIPEMETKYHHQVDMKRLKKFKCSMCPYRSNYRSDIGRHLKRLHINGGAKVVVLDEAAAAATLKEYRDTFGHKKFVLSPAKSRLMTRPPLREEEEGEAEEAEDFPVETEEEEETEGQMPDSEQPTSAKVWKCPRCVFKNKNKQTVMNHMRIHPKIKVFKCRLCGDSSDFRSSMYRHVQMKHNSTDFISYVIENIKYVDKFPGRTRQIDQENAQPVFRCRLCGQTSQWRSALQKHVTEKHKDQEDQGDIIEQLDCAPGDIKVPDLIPRRNLHSSVLNAMNRLHCDVCPYRTNKSGLLRIHKTYHNIQPNNKFKCKFCPYYVSASRLLHQHVRLHLHEENSRSGSDIQRFQLGSEIVGLDFDDKDPNCRVQCDQCPFVCRNKNDFMHHKQFHKPTPGANFKCPDCPYWSAAKRLLTQHRRVHMPDYKGANMKSLPAPMHPGEVSPTKSESDFTDIVDIAQLKQHIITSKILSVPVSPDKFRTEVKPQLREVCDPSVMDGYLVDRAGQLLECGTLKKVNKCHFCPFQAVRGEMVEEHEAMHMERKAKHTCPHCTYQTDLKKLLTKHIFVHSNGYEPGRDEVNDVTLPEGEEDDTEDSGSESESEADKEAADKDKEEEPVKASTPPPEPAAAKPAVKPRPLSLTNIGPHLEPGSLPSNAEFYVKYDDVTGEHIMERVNVKKWCCERCPYATMNRDYFENHVLLHGSQQKCVCEYCDYSVPSYHLLLQHKRLHLQPNPNLLTAQSIANLQRLPSMPADVAAASDFPATPDDPASQSGVHDHLNLYENSPEFTEPKKLYRCDRCPFTNPRRDNLLAHLKFHIVEAPLRCTYCDYSVTKQHLLVQHIRVHFANGSTESESAENIPPETESNDPNGQPEYIDISELGKGKIDSGKVELSEANNNNLVRVSEDESEEPASKRIKLDPSASDAPPTPILKSNDNQRPGCSTDNRAVDFTPDTKKGASCALDLSTPKKTAHMSGNHALWVCQYCDRSFESSPKLMQHEMQHLVGNKFWRPSLVAT